MSRITDSKCKLCRREQTKLFLKGERCYSEKCALTRRQNLPGKPMGYYSRQSEYGLRLREKQKVKRTYGLNEAQMRSVFENAVKAGGDRGLRLLQLLEMRLDNVVYLLGLAQSRASARQLVTHGKIKVNGKKVSIPSFVVSAGDKIQISDPKFSRGSVSSLKLPSWLKKSPKGGDVISEPSRDMIDEEIKEYLIIEFYSR